MLLVSLVAHAQSLVTTTISKESYQPGETVQVEMRAQNLLRQITAANIAVLDARQKKIPIAPFLWKNGNDNYFISFDLPLTLQSGNYTMQIKNVQSAANASAGGETIEQSFEVKGQSSPILTIQPAFIFPQEGQQEITLAVSSKRTTTTITLTASSGITHVYTGQEIVQEGTTRTFKFSLQPAITARETITITYGNSTYTIPVLKKENVSSPIIQPQQPPIKTTALELVTAVKIVNRTTTPEQKISGVLSFKNSGNETLYNITIILTGNLHEIITLNQTDVVMLEPAQIADVHVLVNQQGNAKEGDYIGVIGITAATHQIELPVYIFVRTSPITDIQTKQNATIWSETNQTKPAEFNISFPGDGGQPPVKKKKEFRGIGSLLFTIFFLLIAGIFFMIKNKKTVEKRTFQDYLRERQQKP